MGSSTPRDLDLTDPLVFKMADMNHVPSEADSWSDEGVMAQPVECETCHQSWPCSTRVKLGLTGNTLEAFEWGEYKYHMIRYLKTENPPPFMFADGKIYEMVPEDFYDEDDDDD